MTMHRLSLIFICSLIASVTPYPWGTNQCGPPNHPGGSTSDNSGISVSISGTTVTLSSSRRFRGFYMSTDKGVVWTNIPSGTSASNLCGGGNTVLTHTSSTSRSSISAGLTCTDGQTVTVTTYVVFSYQSAYATLRTPVVCSKGSSGGTNSTTSPGTGSTGGTTSPGTGSTADTGNNDSAPLPVQPYYLAHGIVFIALFAVLMPITAFLILINKSLFYTTHKVLGVLAIIMLVVGWVILNWADDNDADYASLAYVNYGKDHKTYGSIGCYVAAGVCGTGVFLWFLRLPKTMKTVVRYIHGIAGGLLALYGPFVVWTGWIRLAPVSIRALDSTPLVWMSLAIALACAYLITWLVRLSRKKSGGGESSTPDRVITKPDIDQMIANGKLILMIDGAVCEVPTQSFNHPGGMDVLKQYNGKEVGPIMRGSEQASIKTRSRTVAHSDYAIRLAQKMKIGILSGTRKNGDIELGLIPKASSVLITGTIVASQQINKSIEFPVRLFRIKVDDLNLFGKGGIGSGSRVYMSLLPKTEDLSLIHI